MTQYVLHTALGEVTVSLDVEDRERYGPLRYDGTSDAVALVRNWLPYSRGVRHYVIGEAATPLDLAHIMKSKEAERYRPKRIKD